MLGSDLGFLELRFRIHGLTRFDKRDARGTQSKAQANGYTAALDCGFRVN
jgi:hypothetical protein